MKVRYIAAAGVAAVAVTAGFAGPRPTGEAVVEAGVIQRRIVSPARIEPRSGVVTVRASRAGVVHSVDVTVGQKIEKDARLGLLSVRGEPGTVAEEALRAPVASTVLGLSVARGQELLAGEPIATLADVSQLDLRLEIDERDALEVRVGYPVEARTRDGRVVFRGSLKRIGPALVSREIELARPSPSGARVRLAWAAVPPDSPNVLPGQDIEGVVELPAVHVTTRVPRSALRVEDGRGEVLRRWGPLWRPVDVAIGRSDSEYVEIGGLPAGTRIGTR